MLGSKRWTKLCDLAASAPSLYSSFDYQANGVQKWRHIDDPKPTLKRIQRKINARILQPLGLPDGMYGALPGTSVRDHAEAHVGRSCLVTLDLADCFPRTTNRAVYRALVANGCSPEVARLLTRLTTLRGHLPQGAPTSPVLAHLCMREMFCEICSVAAARGLQATCYIDDIALSGAAAADIIDDVVEIIRRHGHRIRSRKTRVMRAGTRQELTGVLVNTTMGAPREYRDKVRHRIVDAGARPDLVPATDLASIWGQIDHVRTLSPAQGRRLAAAAERRLARSAPVGGAKRRRGRTLACTNGSDCRARGRTSTGNADG